MKKFFISLLLMCLFFFDGQAQQTYAVKGRVVDRESREPLSFTSVSVWNSTQGVMTDSLGNYVIENLVPGMYRLQFSIVGYRTYVTPEFRVSSHDYRIDAELEENQGRFERNRGGRISVQKIVGKSYFLPSDRITGDREKSGS